MNSAISNEPSNQVARRSFRRLPWMMAVIAAAGIAVLRLNAANFDFGAVTLLTFLLSIVIWLCVVWGFQRSHLPRSAWRLTLALPILASIVFFSIYRLERVDGELNPQFRNRFQPAAALPETLAPADLVPTIAEPRQSDYPQFLGPSRDGMVDTVAIDPDWDANPPEIAWQQTIGDGWSAFAVQGDMAVTMEQRDQEEWVSAYNVLDGSLLWKYVIAARHTNVMGGTGPRSTPTISNNRVYACSAVSHFACLDLLSGQKIWSQELLELADSTQADFESSVAWGRSASPLIVGNQVVIPLGGSAENAMATLVSFDAETGQELWRAGEDQISYSSPMLATLAGVQQLLLISEAELAAYTIDSGKTLWSVPWPGSSAGSATVSQPVQITPSRILMSKGYGVGAQVIELSSDGPSWTSEEVWKNAVVLKTKFTTCVIRDGYGYGLSDGILECVDLASGKRQWKRGRYRQGQVLLVGQHLLITAENGEIALVAATPERFSELAKLPVIGDVTWNTAAISGNRLLVRNSDEAACVLLPLVEEKGTPESTSSEQISAEGEQVIESSL